MTLRTIQTTVTVSEQHELIAILPDLPPGEYQVVLVIAPQPNPPQKRPFQFPVDNYGALLQNRSLRREDLYGDFGR